MKVLHVISSLDPQAGGPVNAIEGLTSELVRNGALVEILAAFRQGEDPSVADRLRQRGIKLTRVGPAHSPIGYHPQLKTIANQAVSRNDIVHIHALWEDVQHHAARSAQRLNKPYIIRPCGMLDPWSLGQSRIRKRLYLAIRLRRNLNRAAALHFTAQAEHALTDPLKLSASAIIEPNGLDLSEFEHLPSANTFRNAHPELRDRPYVLFLSRIHKKKGLDLLIPAFAQGAPAEFALVIAGPGESDYIDSIRLLAQHHGIASRVLFPGMLSGQQKLAAYAEAELFTLPSYQENFGIVIIEALACGTPVLISDKVNIQQEIVDAGVGLAPRPQLADLSFSLRRCLIENHLIDQPSERMASFAMQRFDWRIIGANWRNHYERLLNSVEA